MRFITRSGRLYAGVSHAPFSIFHGINTPVIAYAAIITGVTLNPNTATQAGSGSTIGTLSISSTGATLVNPVMTMINSAGGDFQLVSGNTVAFLPNNVPANDYSVRIQVSANNAATQQFDVPIHITSASAFSFPIVFTGAAGSTPSNATNTLGRTVDGSGNFNMPTTNYAYTLFTGSGPLSYGTATWFYAPNNTDISFNMPFNFNSAGNNGYLFIINSSGSVQFGKVVNGSYSSFLDTPGGTVPSNATSVGITTSSNGIILQVNGSNTSYSSSDVTYQNGYLGIGVQADYGAKIIKVDSNKPQSGATDYVFSISPLAAPAGTTRQLTATPVGGKWGTGITINFANDTHLTGVTLSSTTATPTAGTTTPVSVNFTAGNTYSGGFITSSATGMNAPKPILHKIGSNKFDFAANKATCVVGKPIQVVAKPANGGYWLDGDIITPSYSGVTGSFSIASITTQNGTDYAAVFLFVPTSTGTLTLNATGSLSTSNGGTTVNVIAAPTSIPLSLVNQDATAIPANAPLQFGHSFSRGDIPANNTALFYYNGTALSSQLDQASYWSDGSLCEGIFTAKGPQTYAANGTTGDTNALTVVPTNSAPNNTPAFTLAAFIAANNITVQLEGLDSANDTWSLSFSDMVAKGAPFAGDAGPIVLPNGAASGATSIVVADATKIRVGNSASTDGITNPVLVTAISGTTITLATPGLNATVATGGKVCFNTPICWYEQLAAGPYKMAWRGESLALAMTNGGGNQGKYHKQIAGMIYVTAYGVNGPFEIEADFYNAWLNGPHPAGTGGTPVNNRANRFIAQQVTVRNNGTIIGQIGGSADARTVTVPSSVVNPSNGAIAYGPYGGGGYNGWGCTISSDGAMPGGLSINTPYWSNNAIISVDRTTVQGPNSSIITSSGSGNITLTPTFCIWPMTSQAVCTSKGKPFWYAGSSGITNRPNIMPVYDQTYLVRSKAVCPFDWTVTTYPRVNGTIQNRGLVDTVENYYPGQPQAYASPWNISQYGDDPGDERVGMITNSEARLLFQQSDPINTLMVESMALGAGDYISTFKNYRSGLPISYNSGKNKDNVQYPGLGPVDVSISITTSSRAPYLVGNVLGTSDWNGVQDTYGPPADESHMPLMGYVAYLRSGRRIFLDRMIQLAMTLPATLYTPNAQVNNNVYPFCLMADNSGQLRGTAWRTKMFAQVAYCLPANDVFHDFINDQLNDSSAYLIDYFPNNIRDYQAQQMGWYNYYQSTPISWQNMYQHTFITVVAGMVAWRDIGEERRPGFRHFIMNWANKLGINIMDQDQGGGFYVGPNGSNNGAYGGNIWDTIDKSTDMSKLGQSPNETWTSAANAVANPSAAGFSDSTVYTGGYPFDTDNYWTCWGKAALPMQAHNGTPKAVTMYNRWHTAVITPPRSEIIWSSNNNAHYDGGYPMSYVPWCFAIPI